MSQIRKEAEFQFNIYISVQIIITIVSFVLSTWHIICIEKLTFKIAKHASTIKGKSKELAAEKKLTERLLYQMLPKNIAKTLKECQEVNAEYFEEVTIFFSDIVDFTELGSRSSPMQIIDLLNDLYGLFDDHIEKYDVYKVETIGDAYMVASGVPTPNGNAHAVHICKLALDLHDVMRQYHVPTSFEREESVKIRIGIHSGPCVAGVVGRKMPRYCLFGDTVNTASRMESSGIGGKIHLSPYTYSIIKHLGCFEVSLRGRIILKQKRGSSGGRRRRRKCKKGGNITTDDATKTQAVEKPQSTPKIRRPSKTEGNSKNTKKGLKWKAQDNESEMVVRSILDELFDRVCSYFDVLSTSFDAKEINAKIPALLAASNQKILATRDFNAGHRRATL
ncbi:atrial natriuretic peptide receptor 1-like [Saccostrea cucullata]|uniref:atrial natriuretic peptide receptor 1-like n=1 Tax=Saccostrea cuccullata TaxID=36930 RepID=UPI002ED06BE0